MKKAPGVNAYPQNFSVLFTIYRNLFSIRDGESEAEAQHRVMEFHTAVVCRDSDDEQHFKDLLCEYAGVPPGSEVLTADQRSMIYDAFKNQHGYRVLAPFDTENYVPHCMAGELKVMMW